MVDALSRHPTSPLMDITAVVSNGGVDTGRRLDNTATQPHFDSQLTNCQLVDGSDVLLSCHVTGNPMPNVGYGLNI